VKGRQYHYYGLEAIAARLNVSKNTVTYWRDKSRLPMYHRQHQHRLVWYINEALIYGGRLPARKWTHCASVSVFASVLHGRSREQQSA
jgi:hypothetical protein